jgi:hypothetical protein
MVRFIKKRPRIVNKEDTCHRRKAHAKADKAAVLKVESRQAKKTWKGEVLMKHTQVSFFTALRAFLG